MQFNDYVLCKIYIKKNKEKVVTSDQQQQVDAVSNDIHENENASVPDLPAHFLVSNQDLNHVVVQQNPNQSLNPMTPYVSNENTQSVMGVQNYQNTQSNMMTLNSSDLPAHLLVPNQVMNHVVLQQNPEQNLNHATPDVVERILANQDCNQHGGVMVMQNYQNTQRNLMVLNSSFSPRFHPEYALKSSYFAQIPQQPRAMPELVEHVPHGLVPPVKYWPGQHSNQLQVTPPFQEGSDCDLDMFLAQSNIDHMYELDGADYGFLGDTMSSDLMGNNDLIDLDEALKDEV